MTSSKLPPLETEKDRLGRRLEREVVKRTG